MKPTLLLLAFSAIIFSSCTSAYKTGQTPDDVYYSPARQQDEYVRVDNDDRYYEDDAEYYEDRQLRMKVRNRSRWSELDDWYYYNNRYSSIGNYNPYYWNNPWNSYSYWNYYYNPYGPQVIVVNPKSVTTYNKPRVFNLNTFTQPQNNGNTKGMRNVGNSRNNSNDYYNTNSRRDAGSTLRNIFNGSGNNNKSNNNSGNSSTRSSSNNNSSSNSGSSSSGSGNAPVRKF